MELMFNERTILSGVHAFYEPEELVGKTLLATGKREQIDIDRYVVNMPWKEKRDFFERMARYVLRILNNTEKGE